ncbi:MAG: ABC transporter ATP-binding protein [Acidobacteria bacterium]|nr:ABC transporter ATP-binding protein [Acidobacteriota bacterium]MCA1650665.1 ABC transporter ATP-binding protein [Acidobacteriota bacterium]
MLQAADVRFAYRPERGGTAKPVLSGVSLVVPTGRVVGILGPNGSGKTTLLRILNGTLRPLAGHVALDGQDLATLSRAALARRMASVPQETHLAFDYSVIEVVLMGRYPHLGAFEVEGPADLAIARRALAATGTLDFEARSFDTLSGGEKQRVIIAAALAQISDEREPRAGTLLLLDEPTAALDLGYQLEVAALVRELNRQLSLSIVVSTHDLNFAAGVCDTLVLLRAGTVLAAGAADVVLTPEHIRALYDVDADVQWHAQAGHLVVVPIGRRA